MPNLFPENLETSTVSSYALGKSLDDTPIGYKKSIFFDSNTGDILRNGKKQLIESTGKEAWEHWCKKNIETPRFSCRAYSTDIGIDIDAVFKATSREEQETILRSEIKEALEADPYGRTRFVGSISFDWNGPDSVEVTVEVEGIDDTLITLKASVRK